MTTRPIRYERLEAGCYRASIGHILILIEALEDRTWLLTIHDDKRLAVDEVNPTKRACQQRAADLITRIEFLSPPQ